MKSLRPLERAGWGQVYRAEMPFKIGTLRSKVSGEQFSERFESEAKAIAHSINPNICQIYDVGPISGHGVHRRAADRRL